MSRSRVFFMAPWSQSWSRLKIIPGAGAAFEKNQEPEPLKNVSAPQSWLKLSSYMNLSNNFSFWLKDILLELLSQRISVESQ